MTEINGEMMIKVPLEVWVKEIAREAGKEVAKELLIEHQNSCPIRALVPTIEETKRRLDKLQLKIVLIVGVLVGSGAIGGGTAFALTKLLGG